MILFMWNTGSLVKRKGFSGGKFGHAVSSDFLEVIET